jgi:PAS domain S-box-containing protein
MRPSARARHPVPRKKARRPAGGQEALQARLREAEQTIDAIRSGQVDALVLRSPDGETVYALETADRPYRVLVEQMAQGAATLDAAGLIVYSNPRLNRLMGVASDALVGIPFASLFSEQLRGEVEQLVAQARTAPSTLETRLMLEGRFAPVQISASPLGLEQMAIVALVTDLSDEKEKAALVAAREALQRADRQKDEFLATLAHELRNPLAPIRNTVSLLQSRLQPGSEALLGVEVIGRQVEHMALLLEDLLDVSQLTRGAMALRKEPVLLQRVVDLAIETSSPVISAAGHELVVALPGRPLVLEADVLRLSQAIANVLNNAAKYTDRGGRIALEAESGDDGFVRVRIRDTGIGISPEALGTIFDLFSQATPALERSQGGLGIGLSLVRGLVELHGGTIEARSRGLGKGSEFVIRLPLAPAGEAESPRVRERAASAGALSLRILVADDNQDSAESLALLLTMMGHDVRTELDGAQAVETARAFQPQVVLLDLGMPRLNGYEAARRIRALPGGDEVVLIAQTGWSQPEDRRRSQEAGFDHHVVKPIPSGSLEKLLAPRRPGAVPPSH